MKYVFTVTAGRSGQNSLADLLSSHVPNSYVAFEEPNPKLFFRRFSGFLGSMESRFRRRFFETNELLGRGKVLDAFEEGNEAYLDRVVAKRLKMIRRKNVETYVDVSKYFARGLHRAFARAVGEFSLILLVRDPVSNMRSFLNRNKDFFLDNNRPDAPCNLLILNPADLSKGELYLWAWCEMYLRYLGLIDEFSVKRHRVIRIEDLNDPKRMNDHLDALGLPHSPLRPAGHLNKNAAETRATGEDILTFERFIGRLSGPIVQQIAYFKTYAPRAA